MTSKYNLPVLNLFYVFRNSKLALCEKGIMNTCPFQSVTGRTLLYKLVISDRVVCLICSLLRPEIMVGGGTKKPVGLKIVLSYQAERDDCFN